MKQFGALWMVGGVSDGHPNADLPTVVLRWNLSSPSSRVYPKADFTLSQGSPSGQFKLNSQSLLRSAYHYTCSRVSFRSCRLVTLTWSTF